MDTDNPFEKVLDRLREKGWRQNGSGREEGPNCIRGATQIMVGLKVLYDGPLLQVIATQYPDRTTTPLAGGVSIVEFNDHPDTTFADVERVLEKAAVKWEEERVMRND